MNYSMISLDKFISMISVVPGGLFTLIFLTLFIGCMAYLSSVNDYMLECEGKKDHEILIDYVNFYLDKNDSLEEAKKEIKKEINTLENKKLGKSEKVLDIYNFKINRLNTIKELIDDVYLSSNRVNLQKNKLKKM